MTVDSDKTLATERRTMFRPLPRRYRLYVIIPGISIMCLYLLIGPGAAPGSPEVVSSHSSRHLLSQTTTSALPNSTTSPTPLWGMCVDGASGEFPPDVFTCQQKRNGAIVLHCIGLVYMFIALAIVCDEFFVPSLQVIIDYLHISEDVAGATFMAAGGSAPELATSFIGTFLAKSSVGIGTIVGSAVFNILFVIAMCAFFSTGVLKLTWWPLFRDVCFYSAALIMLIGFFYDSKIMWWESLILFIWYIAYVVFMGFNPKVEKVVKSACCCSADIVHISEVQGGKVSASHEELVSDYPPSDLRRAPPVGGPGGKRSPASGASEHDLQDEEKERDAKAKRNSQGTQRSSSYPIIRSASGKYRRSVFNMVTQKTVDGSSDLQSTVPEEQQIGSKSGTAPPKYPYNRDDTPDSAKVKSSQQTTVTMVDSSVCSLDKMVEELAAKKRWKAGGQEDENDSAHPANGDLGTAAQQEEVKENSEETRSRKGDSVDDDDDDEDKPLDMSWPDGAWKRITYVICFPIVGLLWLTLFDVRKENRRKFFPWTFIGSIMWIGGFSFLMNWWAKMIGEVIGIPDEVMGLTFLAAGTSIPDLLTSVIVAKKGFGDMAVSSSVGSNLFDVTVGLPIPWFFWSCSQSMAAVQVTSKGMFCSILLLFGMLIAVIISIAAFKWQMSKGLGAAMLVLYVVFLSVSVLMFYDIIPCILSHFS